MKSLLTKSPILAYPTVDGHFTLDTDASGHGVGAVLSQDQNGRERVIAYFSRTLNKAEKLCDLERVISCCHSNPTFSLLFIRTCVFDSYRSLSASIVSAVSECRGTISEMDPEITDVRFLDCPSSRQGHQNADSLSRRPCLRTRCKYCDRQESKEMSYVVDGTNKDCPVNVRVWNMEKVVE